MLDRTEHEKRLVQILFAIYSDKSLSTTLGFKGGTACYFFYDLPRFSTDLDFNLLDEKKKPEVYKKITEVLDQFGRIKDKQIKAKTIFYLLSFNEKSQNIKVEISLRPSKLDQYDLKYLFGLPVLTMAQDCLTAHKLVAIFDRPRLAHRDLFDAWFFLKNDWPVNEAIIKSRTGMEKKEYFGMLADKIEKLGKINILQGLGEVLDRRQKNWTKENLLKELIFLLRLDSKQ